jgi:hypothetical protein
MHRQNTRSTGMADNLVGVAPFLANFHLHLFNIDYQTRKDNLVIVRFHNCNLIVSITRKDPEALLYQYPQGFPMTIKQLFPVAVE